MFNPVSTYRIQFHKDFNFKNFMEIIPYLHELGVVTIYASPIFEATKGSMHGYDVINPYRINPEIGTLEELQAIRSKLKSFGMNWLQDIVPNHMAFDPGNLWLADVLEKGQSSDYVSFFDIDWENPAFDGKLMAPFLGEPLDEAINSYKVQIKYAAGNFTIDYLGQGYPLNQESVLKILESEDAKPVELVRLLSDFSSRDSVQPLGNALRNLNNDSKAYVESIIAGINRDSERLRKVIDQQHYLLSFWKDTDYKINYRRFFTVNGLICLNIQDENVFHTYHSFLKTLLEGDLIQGLRVDHIDGLFDPTTYLNRLRTLAGDQVYIVVEKILEQGEHFPQQWPVQGNTGYDFLGIVNNLLTETRSKKLFTDFYKRFATDSKPVSRSMIEKKSEILYGHMAGELDNLYRLFHKIPITQPNLQTIKKEKWKATIGAFLIHCPVYRYYNNRLPLQFAEADVLKEIFRQVAAAKPELEETAFYLNELFTAFNPINNQADILFFFQRCMQFTGPLMAKGVEDTLMYTYDRFIGHNEVGDSPEEFGINVKQFHACMIERQASWPLSMNGTATHDTKRSEDVRARLNVLTEIPEKWFEQVNVWRKTNQQFKTGNIPDNNDEYLIYQTLVGFIELNKEPDIELGTRLEQYLTKALREAKLHTQWAEPDDQYEQGTLLFARKLLGSAEFLKSLRKFQYTISDAFINNSLTQVLLKFTSPGVPDTYQGCELWDFSLVDPDNRRPVDYELRASSLRKIKSFKNEAIWQNKEDGLLKLWLTEKLLAERKLNPSLFNLGSYIPLQVEGKFKSHFVAFARVYQRQWIISISALHTAAISWEDEGWADTKVMLPPDAPLQWTSVLTNEKVLLDTAIPLNEYLQTLPLLLFKSEPVSEKRGAGIILHITSLPSPYSIGDIGPEARRFLKFLAHSHQRYWQLLPLNATSQASGHSPYSSISSVAGNTLLISPDDLVNEGWLTAEETAKFRRSSNSMVNYDRAVMIKSELLDTAYTRFKLTKDNPLQKQFEDFKVKERPWLYNFALFESIKKYYNGIPWYEWPDDLKYRRKKAIELFQRQQVHEIDHSMWRQFIFFRQWQALKLLGHQTGLKFIGDLPFYVSYDSVDVWSHPELFKLDQDKNLAGVAGVPPDYFNAGGQLWNMPVYKWPEHRATGYAWWLARIKKNMEFFDLIRLDHFRGFQRFWEVPAGEKNAIHGTWKFGPGAKIFQALKKALGDIPFIAEDLGDIDKNVYELRDEFAFPGMNVLQYAFGRDMPVSVHAPHNHVLNSITYTGTHDNNTLLGWLKNDATAEERQHLNTYFRTKVTRKNVNRLMLETCYASVAAIAISPLQDILGLDEKSRINVPASKTGNWRWRVDRNMLSDQTAAYLRLLVKRYNR
nr:malto-oligosyltrehalose synthase [Mucilaginibacter endophyticus]